MKMTSVRMLYALLILCLLNNVQSGPVWGSVALAGCFSGYVACTGGSLGTLSIPCYLAYVACTSISIKEYADENSAYADTSDSFYSPI